MPRKQRESDRVYNARRRAKRLIQRLERDLAASKGAEVSRRATRATAAFIDSLRGFVAQSYADRGQRGVSDRQRNAAERLGSMVTANLRDRQARSNEVFRRELNLARSGVPGQLGWKGQAMVKVFYRATQQIWEGLPSGQRNQAIMEALGTDDLEAAFWQVMRQNRDALRMADRYGAADGLAHEGAMPGTPLEWLVYVNPVYHR